MTKTSYQWIIYNFFFGFENYVLVTKVLKVDETVQSAHILNHLGNSLVFLKFILNKNFKNRMVQCCSMDPLFGKLYI